MDNSHKITDKISALPPGSNYVSLEFFPPKTSMGASNLRARLDRMSRALRPLFVTVTWGAGGSTAKNSLELAELCQRGLGLTTCLHLTCTNASQDLVDQTLEDARAIGIRNILALRGDPPRKEYAIKNPEKTETVKFEWAIDLVRYIRRKYGDYFCIGVAAYPEGHLDINNPEDQSLEYDLPYLVEKVKAGADFVMTQLFFDTDAYDSFLKRLSEHESGCFNLPIIPGMMPIQGYQMIKRTLKLTGAQMPQDITDRLSSIKGDDELVKKVGIDIISEIVTHIKNSPIPSTGRRGFHFYTLNLEKAVSFIMERASLIASFLINSNKSEYNIVDLPILHSQILCNNNICSERSDLQNSTYSNPSNQVVVTGFIQTPPFIEATSTDVKSLEDSVNAQNNTLAISEGEGSLGREATWDDFPNGRWGDSRSPAYGEIGGYSVNLHVSSIQGIRLWGYPKSPEDITSLFIRHIEGSLSAIPWSDEGICRETDLIKENLLQLNRKGWWTIASQPSVNGVRSNDDIFGWGPPNGFVFQKAFVEFFIQSENWRSLKKKLQSSKVAEDVSWYASNVNGEFFSSDDDIDFNSENKCPRGSTHAVTWGVFPGKEIVTPTIIEEVSFRAWSEEAFGIWAEWKKVYNVPGFKAASPRENLSQKLIEGLRKDVWLVNIIHHDFIEGDCLWKVLSE